ncbi:MAG: polysaccharide biosynthesis tyrosine autokinase, partial [Acidimicrobiales bacterium]
MDQQDTELELRDYLRVARRRWAWIAVTALLLAGVGFLNAWRQPSSYQAKAEVLIDFVNASDPLDPNGGRAATGDRARLVKNEVNFLTSQAVLGRLGDRLGYAPAANAKETTGADTIELSVTGADPQTVADAANAYMAVYLEARAARTTQAFVDATKGLEDLIAKVEFEIADLEKRPNDPRVAEQLKTLDAKRRAYVDQRDRYVATAAVLGNGSATVLSDAEVPSAPIAPKPVRSAVLGLTVGLVLGAGLAFLRDYLDDRVEEIDDLTKLAGGAQGLAVIPRAANQGEWDAHVHNGGGRISEAFRSLRTSIQFAGLKRPLRSLQVTSANAGEGKTTVIMNLAIATAQAGQDVLLIDCDLRSPSVHSRFSLPNERGVSNVIARDADINDVIQPVGPVPGLYVLPAGPALASPADLLASTAAACGVVTLQQIVQACVDAGFFVLVDCPPVLAVTDALSVSYAVDGTVFVAAANRTSGRQAARAIGQLEQVNAKVVGVVLNAASRGESGYGYGYGYGYGSQNAKRDLAAPVWRDRFGGRRHKESAAPALAGASAAAATELHVRRAPRAAEAHADAGA